MGDTPCLFCTIVEGQIPAEIIYYTDHFIVIRDIHPQAPVHVLAIPKIHRKSILDFGLKDVTLLQDLVSVIQHITQSLGLDNTGFRVVTNVGHDGGQTVDHVHFHILGGRPMRWPPG